MERLVHTRTAGNLKLRQRLKQVESERAAEQLAPQSLHQSLSQTWQHPQAPRLAIAGVILTTVFFWAYWTTLESLVGAWNREPDYSHGFLVAPLAFFFLWTRRDRFPGITDRLAWPGLALIVLSVGMRVVASRYYLEAIDGWSIMVWAGGVAWLLGGWRVFRWSLPAVAFLWFMVPLPFRLERALSLPLQSVATKLSCWGLQILGQPAVAEGHTILLGDYPLEIERACSGLRIFVGIVALAFAYVVVVRRTWWEKAILLASVIPIALVANATRIVATGLFYQWVSADAAKSFTHDAAGWVMILFAAGLFALVLWYLSRLVREVEVLEVGTMLRRGRAEMQRPRESGNPRPE